MKTKKRKKKIGYFAVLCFCLLVLTTGCSDEKSKKEDSPAAGVSQSPEVAPTEQADKSNSDKDSNQDSDQVSDKGASDDLELEKAKNAALQDAGLKESDVSFTKNQRDTDAGTEVYEIEFKTDKHEYEYEVKASDAQILKSSKEEIRNKSTDQNSDTTKNKEYITEETAKKTALDQVQLKENQVKFSKVKLDKDNDDGVDEYEIEFYTDDMEYDFTIHAVSGAVLKIEKERK